MTDHNDYDTMLTLAIPGALEEELIDLLQAHPQWAGGFSIVDAQGMGQGASLATPIEQVLGRCKRKLVFIVGRNDALALLVQMLAQHIRNSDTTYWFTPVTRFGRLQ